MDPNAWILCSANDAESQVFTPLGGNTLQVNVDGQSLPPGSSVTSSDWVSLAHAIRTFADARYGIGSTEVTVINSRFRNLNYAIQTEGAQRWRILRSQFSRTRNSAILFGYSDGQSCLHNLVQDCTFEQHGDTACAFYRVSGAAAECAYNSVVSCTAKDTNMRTQGFAFDIEGGGSPDKKHDNRFVDLTVEQTHNAKTGTGGAVMNGVSNCAIIGFVGKGSLASTGDYGIAMTQSRDSEIVNPRVSHFRAAGINLDGSSNIVIRGGVVTDCGGDSSVYPAILLANAYANDGCQVDGTEIVFSTAYAYAAATSAGVAVRTGGGGARNISISTRITSPWGVGIYVSGLLAGGRASNVTSQAEIVRTAPGVTPAIPIQYYGVDGGSVRARLNNCSYGYFIQSCTSIIVHDGEHNGSSALLVLYNFAGSSGIQVRDMRTYVDVVTAVAADGRGTTWVNDNKVSTSTRANSP